MTFIVLFPDEESLNALGQQLQHAYVSGRDPEAEAPLLRAAFGQGHQAQGQGQITRGNQGHQDGLPYYASPEGTF